MGPVLARTETSFFGKKDKDGLDFLEEEEEEVLNLLVGATFVLARFLDFVAQMFLGFLFFDAEDSTV